MNKDAKSFWDAKYQQGLPSLTKPDPFFIEAYERFIEPACPIPGDALDLAGGLGRHSLWLASHGWRVKITDISEVALQAVRESSSKLGLEIGLIQGDAANYPFPTNELDLILLYYHLDRTLFPKISEALKVGGLFVCKMRVHLANSESLENDSLLGEHEIFELLPKCVVVSHTTRPVGDRAVLEFVGRKV